MQIKWVQQIDINGCGIAALAMITDKSYHEIKDYYGDYFNQRGLSQHDLDDYLVNNNYAIARKYKYSLGKIRDIWPPLPFGKIHLSEVIINKSSPLTHTVVMLDDGSISDPLTPIKKKLSDYWQVCNLALIVKIDY